MKSCVRIGTFVIALGLAGLLAGCVSPSARTGQRVRPANDFEIVETSTKRNLTPKEMAELRAMVAEYLVKEGATDSGDYYVKVFLSPEQAGVPAEWVVVRYSRDTSTTGTRFSLLSSYPSYADSYSSYLAYDYYPFSYYGFGRLSFQYYDDPYFPNYGYGRYYPRRTGTGRPHHGNHRPHDRDHDGNRPPRGDHQTGNPVTPGEPPRVTTRTRWNSNSPTRNGQDGENGFPMRSDPRYRNRSRDATPGTPPSTLTGNSNPTNNQPATVSPGIPATVGRPYRMTPAGDRTSPTYNRTQRDTTTSVQRPVGGRERTYTPPGSPVPAQPRRESQGQHTTRQVQSTTSTPPATRSTPPPAPSYTPPPATSTPAASRSEPATTRDKGQQSGGHDSGRRGSLE